MSLQVWPSPSPSPSLALSDIAIVVVTVDIVAGLVVAVLRDVTHDSIGNQTHVGPAENARALTQPALQ